MTVEQDDLDPVRREHEAFRVNWRSGLIAAAATTGVFALGRWLLSDTAAVGLALVALGGVLRWRVLVESTRQPPGAD